MEIKLEIKIDEVYLCCLEDQIPTVLLYKGRRYNLEKKEQEKTNYELSKLPEHLTEKKTEKEPEIKKNPVTKDLQQLVNERAVEELQATVKKKRGRHHVNTDLLGPVVARSSSGNLINRKPLDEMLALRERGKLTSEVMEEILGRYHPDVKPGTLTCYKSGYKTYIENPDEGDVRTNTPPKAYENVTDKDIRLVKKAVQVLGNKATAENILKELDMTEYKLGLVLKEFMVFESFEDDGKIKYRLK
jgi:hypothetical protein